MGVIYRGRCYHCCRTQVLDEEGFCSRCRDRDTLSYRRTNEDLVLWATLIYILYQFFK
jgi:hypothetical protein